MIHEILPGLYIADVAGYRGHKPVNDTSQWSYVLAAKDPYHRALLGYTGRAAPKEHPEYLWAERHHSLTLNLIDAPDPAYIPIDLIERALDFIDEEETDGRKVMIACDRGLSRAPSLALMYVIRQFVRGFHSFGLPEHPPTPPIDDSNACIVWFSRNLYPNYLPGIGMMGFIRQNWDWIKESTNAVENDSLRTGGQDRVETGRFQD